MSATKPTAEQVDEFLASCGIEVPESHYSGRNMYGAKCPSFEADSDAQIFSTFVEMAKQDSNLASILAKSAKTDSMGRGIVVYWPFITFTKKGA